MQTDAPLAETFKCWLRANATTAVTQILHIVLSWKWFSKPTMALGISGLSLPDASVALELFRPAAPIKEGLGALGTSALVAP